MTTLIQQPLWQALLDHQKIIAPQHMRDWFLRDHDRFDRFSIAADGIFLDYSRNRIDEKTLELLCQLADAVQLPAKIAALFSGKPINITENRPALHTALRDGKATSLLVNDENIIPAIKRAQTQAEEFVAKIHTKSWKGATGKPIKSIVNIGIGGSHLGPMMATHALSPYAVTDLQFEFVSTVDKANLDDALKLIDPETTLFIISSKSFNTIETLTNANTIVAWMKGKVGTAALAHHFVAVTAAPKKAVAFGIPAANCFPLWEWVGGRYSIWSAIGLPLRLMIGNQQFADFLAGAHEMDLHFKHADFKQNIPVLLALLSIWYNNFFAANAHAIAPYSHRLRHLVDYLQQAEMESNGKRNDLSGNLLPYTTSPIIFGEEGCNGQHAYHQLLHQGPHLVPVDFILIGNEFPDVHHDILIASGLSQAQALMHGKTYDEAYAELIAANPADDKAKQIAPHRVIPGNRPSNVLFLDRLSPKNLGALLALYEHKIFVQGAIWNINSFDQWGVELGKQLLPAILNELQLTKATTQLDCATEGLIRRYKASQRKA